MCKFIAWIFQISYIFYALNTFPSWIYRKHFRNHLVIFSRSLSLALSLYYIYIYIWKSDPTDKMKRSFFQTAVTSILLYGCTTWTLTKRLEKKLDGNYTRMLRAILNKSWQQHPTRHQLYGHLPPITKLFKLDEPDMQDTAGEAEMNS